MMLPLIAWALTGIIFLTKPGYNGAYERLNVKTYELDSEVAFLPHKDWEEMRLIRTVLGLHLLAKKDGAYKQFDSATLLPKEKPTTHQVEVLISDAISVNSKRYGLIEQVDGLNVYTNAGITIELNWDDMTLSQRGKDRKIIETLYKIHYLQWTKWEGVNLMLGVLGLVFLITLTFVGLSSYVRRSRDD